MVTIDQDYLQTFSKSADLGRGLTPEAILRRAELLPDEERRVVLMTLRGRLSRELVSSITGVNKGTVTRRLQRAGARLHDPMVIQLFDAHCLLPQQHRQIALGRWLSNRSLEDLASAHQLSVQQVLRMLDYVRGWFQGARHARTRQTLE